MQLKHPKTGLINKLSKKHYNIQITSAVFLRETIFLLLQTNQECECNVSKSQITTAQNITTLKTWYYAVVKGG